MRRLLRAIGLALVDEWHAIRAERYVLEGLIDAECPSGDGGRGFYLCDRSGPPRGVSRGSPVRPVAHDGHPACDGGRWLGHARHPHHPDDRPAA